MSKNDEDRGSSCMCLKALDYICRPEKFGPESKLGLAAEGGDVWAGEAEVDRLANLKEPGVAKTVAFDVISISTARKTATSIVPDVLFSYPGAIHCEAAFEASVDDHSAFDLTRNIRHHLTR